MPLTPPIGSDMPSLELSELNKIDSPILRLKKQMMDALMSPESESSSFHISSTSSSDIKESKPIDKNDDNSAPIVTSEQKFEPKGESNSAEELQTSPIISTSPRALSSSRILQRKSDPTIDEKMADDDNESVSFVTFK